MTDEGIVSESIPRMLASRITDAARAAIPSFRRGERSDYKELNQDEDRVALPLAMDSQRHLVCSPLEGVTYMDLCELTLFHERVAEVVSIMESMGEMVHVGERAAETIRWTGAVSMRLQALTNRINSCNDMHPDYPHIDYGTYERVCSLVPEFKSRHIELYALLRKLCKETKPLGLVWLHEYTTLARNLNTSTPGVTPR